MNDKRDPWSRDPFAAAAAITYHDPFEAAMRPATAVAQVRRELPTFEMARGQFVGPDTDPVTDGPNWDQGPLQRP